MVCCSAVVNEYWLGKVVRTTAVFTDQDTGLFVNPTIVTLCYKMPDSSEFESAALVPDSLGHYHYDIDTTLGTSGRWYYKYKSTGAGQSVEEYWFDVLDPEVDT